MLPRLFSAPSLFVTAFVGISFCVLTHGDRMPPNVNPNHYQANQPPPPPPPPQHHQQQYQQQVPQHQQQQVPQQQHQVPQQQQVPQQHQQVPQQQQHHQQQQQVQQQQQMQPQVAGHGGSGGHHHGGGLLDRDHIEANKEDIGHHFDMPVDTSKMNEQELQFHYFKMHDADNNNMLDGLELVKSLIHWHDPQNHDPNAGVAPPEPKIFPDSELENMIDPILKADDRNGDGFIDYLEFVKAQEAAAAQAATQQRA